MRGVPLSALTQRHRNFACNCVCVCVCAGRDYSLCVCVCECGRLDAGTIHTRTHTNTLALKNFKFIVKQQKQRCLGESFGLPHEINNNKRNNKREAHSRSSIELGSTLFFLFLLLLLFLPINSANFVQICFWPKEGGHHTNV